MSYSISESSLNDLKALRHDSAQSLKWSYVFILPEWMQTWWQVFGERFTPYIRIVKDGEKTIGVAPLMTKDNTAYLIGDTDVCDYLDFVVVPGMENDFFSLLLDDLKKNNIKSLDLKHVRPNSIVMMGLVPLAESRQYKVTTKQEAVSFEMDLPSSFDEYLQTLSTKQRHEVRRKLRRLNEEGKIEYRLIDAGDDLPVALDTFFRMFTESREDKAAFLTERMKSYFCLLVDNMRKIDLLKLGVLELDGKQVAEIMCFDYNDCIYLYNSGYDPQYVSLSVGLLSKVFAVEDSIDRGKKKFDFLKGAENYKGHLGGKEVPLYRCQIHI
ncbi:MAG: GNAT family N-acetyltransferase [Dehalococcoidales bacterium]|nr:GNAT family N-acetyltransferase [Dehalococcoidales bacterium]